MIYLAAVLATTRMPNFYLTWQDSSKLTINKYREIITIEELLKDETDQVYGYFPGTLVWREIMSEFSFRSSLIAQYKHDPQSALRFEIRKARTGMLYLLLRFSEEKLTVYSVASSPALVSIKPLGGNDD